MRIREPDGDQPPWQVIVRSPFLPARDIMEYAVPEMNFVFPGIRTTGISRSGAHSLSAKGSGSIDIGIRRESGPAGNAVRKIRAWQSVEAQMESGGILPVGGKDGPPNPGLCSAPQTVWLAPTTNSRRMPRPAAIWTLFFNAAA